MLIISDCKHDEKKLLKSVNRNKRYCKNKSGPISFLFWERGHGVVHTGALWQLQNCWQQTVADNLCYYYYYLHLYKKYKQWKTITGNTMIQTVTKCKKQVQKKTNCRVLLIDGRSFTPFGAFSIGMPMPPCRLAANANVHWSLQLKAMWS